MDDYCEAARIAISLMVSGRLIDVCGVGCIIIAVVTNARLRRDTGADTFACRARWLVCKAAPPPPLRREQLSIVN